MTFSLGQLETGNICIVIMKLLAICSTYGFFAWIGKSGKNFALDKNIICYIMEWSGLTIFLFALALTFGQLLEDEILLDAQHDFVLKWNHSNGSMDFEVSAKTQGWIAFGFSPNGGMDQSDVMFGFVDKENGGGNITVSRKRDISRKKVNQTCKRNLFCCRACHHFLGYVFFLSFHDFILYGGEAQCLSWDYNRRECFS